MPNDLKVEIYKLANRLKERLGSRYKDQEEGFIAPEAIEEADKLISNLCVNCPKTISGHLDTLGQLWDRMRALPQSDERAALSGEIFTLAHEIKDVGAMCGYDLLSYFAESLRDYIGRTELNIEAQMIIIQTHIDTMQMVHRRGIKKDESTEAEELKRLVRHAIEKYH
jgi:hypothetical protein